MSGKRTVFPSSMIKILWLVALVLLILIGWRLPLYILVGIIVLFLLAPLWREFRPRSDLDERQVFISHFSSHIAFYIFLALLLFTGLTLYASQHKNPELFWYALLLIPLTVKFLVSLFQNYGAVTAAQWIGYFFGFSWLLFAVLGHGYPTEVLLETIPFLIIITIAWFSPKHPRISGALFLLLAIGMVLFFRGWSRFDIFVRLLMFTLLPLPLLVSGIALIRYREEEP